MQTTWKQRKRKAGVTVSMEMEVSIYMICSGSHQRSFGTSAHPLTPTDPRTMLLIGHRGSSENYPENTMLAFEKSVQEGAHGIETDIWKTSDGAYVLVHDATVNRTTNGTGAISNLTWDQISQLDAGAWKGAEFADRPDTKVPRLDAFLDHFKGKPVFLCLQIKLGLSDCLDIVDMIEEKKMLDQCFIFTNHSRLAAIRDHTPKAFIMNDGTNHEAWGLLQQAKNEGWNAISPGVNNVTQDLIEAANKSGIFVMASFVSNNYTTKIHSLIDMGCHFILGDHCAAMVAVGKGNDIEQITPSL